jgi:aryl-alcohol dehydrogenase-like predicted oxidoreductase
MYSRGRSEEITGKALGELARRDEVVIATKVYFPVGKGPNQGGLGRKHVLAAIDDSLRRLGTDYVDLYQIHRWDDATPIEETLEALHDVVRAGKARYVGASSMFAWQLAKSLFLADLHGWTRFVSMQNHYNLVYREEEREMVPLCRDQGLGVIPWSPLARGLFAGTRTRGGEARTTRAASDDYTPRLYRVDADFDVVDRCVEVAGEVGASPSQVALAWLLGRPGVTAPIVGTTRMEHLEEAVAALEVELTPDQVRRLEEPYLPHPVLGHG